MNTLERVQLTSFLQQLTQAALAAKDAEAEKLILEACARQPDAAYLLVQRSMLLDQALRLAQAEIARLQSPYNGAPSGSSSALNSTAWGNTAPPSATSCAPTRTVVPSMPVTTPAWGAEALGSVATTAAGVVAGAFLLQGIDRWLGDHGSAPGQIPDKHLPPVGSLASAHETEPESPPVDLDALGPDMDSSG